MSLGASAYAVGMAQNPGKYLRNLLRNEGNSASNRAILVADLLKKEAGPGSRRSGREPEKSSICNLVTKMAQLQAHFGYKNCLKNKQKLLKK